MRGKQSRLKYPRRGNHRLEGGRPKPILAWEPPPESLVADEGAEDSADGTQDCED